MAINGGSDRQLVVVGAEDGQAHVCHIGSKKVVASVRHAEVTNTMAPFGTAGGMEEDGDEDGAGASAVSVEAVGFSPQNPNWLATGGVDGVVKIWDLANGAQCRQTCRPVQSGEGVTRLRWHPVQPLVFTASTSGAIRLWDARNGSLLSTLTGHGDVINDLSISYIDGGNKALICTVSDDKTVRLFQLDVLAALPSVHSHP
jgi:ribosome assembly protein SQT1